MGSVFATVLSGTLVYVLGQIVIRFIIEPMQEQWRVIGQIAEALLYHEYLFAGPEITPQEAKDTTLRFYQLATELMARTAMIPKYDLLAKVSFVRPYTEIVRATKGLNGLSNTLTRADWIGKSSLAIQVALSLGIDRIDLSFFNEEFRKGIKDQQ